MAQRLAGKKDIRKNKKRYAHNQKIRNKLKTALKEFKKALKEENADQRKKVLSSIYQALDKAAKNKVIHPRKAARKKSRLSLQLNKIKTQA